MWNVVALPNRLAADIEASIEARDRIDQTDRVDVDHRVGIGIITDGRTSPVTGSRLRIPMRVGAEQFRLQAEQGLVAGRELQHDIDAGLLPNQHGQ